MFDWVGLCSEADVVEGLNVHHIGSTRLQRAPISRCTILAAPISLISTHCERGAGSISNLEIHTLLLPPNPPPSDRIQFVFSFSTTAINKHPVTISNCLSHREGGVGQIVMRDCKWYLSQILSCA